MQAIFAIIALSVLCVALFYGRLHEPECNSFDVIEKLLDKMVRVEFKMETFQTSMMQWEAEMDALLTKTATNMDAWQTQLDAAETNLQAKSANMEKQLTDALHKHKHELQAINTETTDALEATEQRLEKKDQEVASQLAAAFLKIQDLQTIQEAYQTPTVVFTARDARTSDVVAGQPIIFVTVLTNLGDGYNSSTGVFTAPYSGLYMFTTTVCSSIIGKSACVHLVAAGTGIASTLTYQNDRYFTCTSTSGVAVLSTGETTRVNGAYSQTKAMLTGGSSHWPSFAGMLVHKT